MEISKIQNWESSLYAYIKAAEERPFSWGEHDCCLFPAGAVLAITGIDPAEKLRDQYASEKEAEDLINQYGGATGFAESLLEPLGFKKLNPAYAQRGDIAFLRVPNGEGLYHRVGAVCVGRGFAFLTDQGMREVPITYAMRKLDVLVWGLR